MKIVAGFLLLCAVSTAQARNANACFQDRLPYFENFSRVNLPSGARIDALRTACDEIQNGMMMSGSSARTQAMVVAGSVATALAGRGAASFSSLSDSASQRRYRTELEQIRQIPDSMERIRRVYNLAARYSGEVDQAQMGRPNAVSGLVLGWLRPENLLSNAERRGSIGVCREFAMLLSWSLQQVSRHPSSRGGALGPHDFSAEYALGIVPGRTGWSGGGGHAWVRINMPRFTPQGRLDGFTHFDLDNMWYPQFTPLFPRRSGVSAENLQRAIRECDAIQVCLLNNASVNGPFSLSAPASRRTGAPSTR